MNRMAYEQGKQAALTKYASGVGSLLNKRNLNVAGLSLIAAPTLHSLFSKKEDSPGLEKTKQLSDLAGLGLLIGTEYMKH